MNDDRYKNQNKDNGRLRISEDGMNTKINCIWDISKLHQKINDNFFCRNWQLLIGRGWVKHF
jgi:hypothetical protein